MLFVPDHPAGTDRHRASDPKNTISCSSIVPPASRRTLKGSAVVAIGVRRRGVGRDNGPRRCLLAGLARA